MKLLYWLGFPVRPTIERLTVLFIDYVKELLQLILFFSFIEVVSYIKIRENEHKNSGVAGHSHTSTTLQKQPGRIRMPDYLTSSSGRPHLVLFSQGPFLPNLDTTSIISDPGFSPVSDCPDPNPNSQEKLVPRIFQDYWELKGKG